MFNKVILTPKGQQLLNEVKKDLPSTSGHEHSRIDGHSQHPSVDLKQTTEFVRYSFSPKGLRSPKDFYKSLISSKTILSNASPQKNPKEFESAVQRIVSRNAKRNAEVKKTITEHLPMLKSDFLTKTLGVGKNNPLWQKSNLMITSMNAELYSTLENCWLKYEESKVNKMIKKFDKFKTEKQELETNLNDRLKKENEEFQMNVMNRDNNFWNQFNNSVKDVHNLWKNKLNEDERFEKRLRTYQNNKFKREWMKTYIPHENTKRSRSPSPEAIEKLFEVSPIKKPIGKFHKRQDTAEKDLNIGDLVQLKGKIKLFRRAASGKANKKIDLAQAAATLAGNKEEIDKTLTIAGQKEFKLKGTGRDDIILKSSTEQKYKKPCPIYQTE